jgi:tripartite-type tricarboxylate transporter receptor subunit TctC
MRRRRFILVRSGAGLLLLATLFDITGSRPATAEGWPTRPVTMVVPSAAGGALDVFGRVLAPRFSELLGQTVIVENMAGAGAMLGATRVAKAPPDGSQFVLGTAATHAQSQTLYKKPPFNSATDFAPVALIVDQPMVLIARKDLPINDLQEFIAHAKTNQAKMQYGSAGAGSGPHLACALLNAAIGVNVTHVPYRGGGPAIQDLIAGRLDYQCTIASTAIPQIEANVVKPIAILTKDRLPILPTLASAHEQGLVDFEAADWFAIFFPKGTPASIVGKLHDTAVATMETPSVQMRLKEIGAIVVAPERRSQEYLANFVLSEIERWAAVIRASGVSMD